MSAESDAGLDEAQADERPASTRLFTLESTEYEVPLLSTLDLDEERILYLWADVVIQDLIPAHPELDEKATADWNRIQSGRFRNPAFKRALAHIAYRRAHPEADSKTIEAAIGKVNALKLDLAVIWSDDDPPALSSQRLRESENESSEASSSTPSGGSTANGSGQVAENREPTGTGESGTSSPPSLATTSVA